MPSCLGNVTLAQELINRTRILNIFQFPTNMVKYLFCLYTSSSVIGGSSSCPAGLCGSGRLGLGPTVAAEKEQNVSHEAATA